MKRTILYTGLMAGIAGFTITATPAALAQTYDKTWTGSAMNNNWFTDNNWEPAAHPVAGDTVRIPGSDGAPIAINIGDQDAACESISMDWGNITIKGRTLTIGDDSGTTTTDIDHGQFTFEQGATRGAEMLVRNWVCFTGTGRLYAHAPENADYRPVIRRQNSYSDSGIKTLDDFDVRGHLTLLVSVYHDGDEFGVWSEKNTMIFGDTTDVFDPDLKISGAALNDETFTAYWGKIEFVQMEFASTAPRWYAVGGYIGGGNSYGTIIASAERNNVPNDVDLESYSILQINYDQTFNGKLHMHSQETKVLAKDGALVKFEAP